MTKYNIPAFASKSQTEKPLTKAQHSLIDSLITKHYAETSFDANDDSLTFLAFVHLTAFAV